MKKTLDSLAHSHVAWAVTLFAIMIIQSLIAEEIILTMKAEGYKLGWFFSFLNALATFVIAMLKTKKKFTYRIQSRMTSAHVVAGGAFSLAQGMAGFSQLFLRFNTVTVFKSSKVVFVMLVSHLLLDEPVTVRAVVYSLSMSVGLFVLSNSDIKSSKKSNEREDSMFGIFLIVVALGTSAIGNVLQQAVLQRTKISFLEQITQAVTDKLGFRKRYRKVKETDDNHESHNDAPSRKELKEDLLLYSSFVTAASLFCVCAVSDELFQGFYFFWNQSLLLCFKQFVALYLTAMSQRLVLSLNQVYGATSTSLLLTVRKVSSFVMSVLVFPKPFNFGHAFGAVDVALFALLLQNHIQKKKKAKAKWKINSMSYLKGLDIV